MSELVSSFEVVGRAMNVSLSQRPLTRGEGSF